MPGNIWDKPDLLVRTGSHLYGCSVPTSDVDTRGFVVEPAEMLLGRGKFEQHETKAPAPDAVIWGFKKFFGLLERFSPNTIEIIFAPKEHILEITTVGQLMIDNRKLFLRKELVNSMSGFALSEWNKAVNYFDQMRKLGAQRKEHIAAFGYSIKNAYHAIRLLEECIEFLETGDITFPRPNADYLRKIRHGEIGVEEVTARWSELDAQVPLAKEKSPLPDSLDADKINDLYFSCIREKLTMFMYSKYDLAVVQNGTDRTARELGVSCV